MPVVGGAVAARAAEPFEASTLLAPTDSIALKFNDGGGHVALLVRRTGTIEGDGPFAGAAVVEVGLHDFGCAALAHDAAACA